MMEQSTQNKTRSRIPREGLWTSSSLIPLDMSWRCAMQSRCMSIWLTIWICNKWI